MHTKRYIYTYTQHTNIYTHIHMCTHTNIYIPLYIHYTQTHIYT